MSVYKHTPKGFVEPSVIVAIDGMLQIITVDPVYYVIWGGSDKSECLGCIHHAARTEINPIEILSAVPLSIAMISPDNPISVQKEENPYWALWQSPDAVRSSPDSVYINTPLALVKMTNGDKYLIPAEIEGLRKARKIARDIFTNTTPKLTPREKRAASLRARGRLPGGPSRRQPQP